MAAAEEGNGGGGAVSMLLNLALGTYSPKYQMARREFGTPPIDYPTYYKHDATLMGGGADHYVSLGSLGSPLTEELFADGSKKQELESAFIEAVNRNACAAINARKDTTICVGVSHDGRVEGLEIGSRTLVRPDDQLTANVR